MMGFEIACLLWRDGCFHELAIRHDDKPVTLWIPCDRPRAFERWLDAPDVRMSIVPRTTKQDFMVGLAPVLWCYLRDPKAMNALQRFRPPPTLVLRAGRSHHRWALWGLSRPLWGEYIERATERLAHHLHGLRRAARASTLIPAPFTSLEVADRRRQMFIEYESGEVYQPRQVVGHLRDAPPIDGWRRNKSPTGQQRLVAA